MIAQEIKLKLKILAELNGRPPEFIQLLILRVLQAGVYKIDPEYGFRTQMSASQADFEDEIAEFLFHLDTEVTRPPRVADSNRNEKNQKSVII